MLMFWLHLVVANIVDEWELKKNVLIISIPDLSRKTGIKNEQQPIKK